MSHDDSTERILDVEDINCDLTKGRCISDNVVVWCMSRHLGYMRHPISDLMNIEHTARFLYILQIISGS